MNILYLVDQYKPECYSGTVKFAENIVKNFSLNNNVLLVSYCEDSSKNHSTIGNVEYWEESIDNIDCIKFYTKDTNKINFNLYDENVYKFGLMIIEKFKPDIVHVCHPRRIASFMKAAIDTNTKYIITFTDNFMICQRSILLTKSCQLCIGRHKDNICTKECGLDKEIINNNKIYSKQYIENATALTAPSKFQCEIYEEYFEKQVLNVSHGNNINNQVVVEKKYPKEKLIFVFNGSSMTVKGLIIAIGAFNILEKEKNINVELRIYGPCDDTIRLMESDNIKYFGKYKNHEISKILNLADVLLCPSIWYENYPFVITEALIHRVPVIASNEGGMKEIVKNFVNGFTFNIGDSEHLAEIIISLYNNQKLIEKIRENLQNFKFQNVQDEMDKYCEIYESCNNNKSIKKEKKLLWIKTYEEIIKNKYNCNDIEMYKKCIEEVCIKYKYQIGVDLIYKFILRLKNMESRLKNKKNIIIWGIGTAGILTIEILKRLYQDLEIKFIIDKFKSEEEYKGIKIKSIEILTKENFEYLFICTTPGKNEAILKMNQLEKEINVDYNYGICVE